MRKRFAVRRPSAAMIVALAALFVALGGTSYAAFSLPRNTVGTKQLRRGAVTTSKLKKGAVTAAKIDMAGLTVPNAVQADNATNAGTAALANAIGTVDYVQGNPVTAPANGGGNSYAESDISTATCPAGTFVIGTGGFTSHAGVEDSEILALSGPGSPAPNEVEAYFDNFTNMVWSGNYAEAICAAVHTTSNPAPLMRLAARRR